ncbi:MAG: hypothetical protein IPM26_08345 [Saprospiraceae bacterium]|nr:hypothetical protein [Saprospiraceae bacterium]
MNKLNHLYAFMLLVAVAGVARIIPHIPNFTPVEGVTLFGAAYMGRKYLGWFLPVLMLYVTDLILNNTVNRVFFQEKEGWIFYSDYMIYVWISIVLISIGGSYILTKVNAGRVLGAALFSSFLFFVVTNFGVWLHSTTLYSKDLSGLTQCYIAAWPFFRTSLLSNLLFVTLLFGGYELLKKYLAIPQSHEA